MTHVEHITKIVKSNLKLQETISIAAQTEDNPNNENKEVVFKNSAPFTNCISEINNTQIDNAKDIDIILPYMLIEYSNNYSKTLGSLKLTLSLIFVLVIT